MAWSDAARRAAAEVRRLHGMAKKQYPKGSAPAQWDSNMTSLRLRKSMAGQLRLYRAAARGEAKAFPGATTAMRIAARSTQQRNAFGGSKKFKRFRLQGKAS